MEYKPVHNMSYHVAEIWRRGKCIARARNSVGSLSRGAGWSKNSIHAERAVVKRLGDVSQLDGCVLFVVRINKQGELRNSMPCRDCRKFLEKCMAQYGLRKVVYSY